MPSATVELRNIAGTEAAVGWAGAHTVVVDRPDGKAGGRPRVCRCDGGGGRMFYDARLVQD
jgi:hypothetical protein